MSFILNFPTHCAAQVWIIARFVSTINHWGRFQYSAMNTYYVAFHFHKGQIFNHLQELSRKNTYQPELLSIHAQFVLYFSWGSSITSWRPGPTQGWPRLSGSLRRPPPLMLQIYSCKKFCHETTKTFNHFVLFGRHDVCQKCWTPVIFWVL